MSCLWCLAFPLSVTTLRFFNRLIIIMRTKEIRLSDDEKRRLQKYKTSKYDEQVPYGFIIGQILDEVEE